MHCWVRLERIGRRGSLEGRGFVFVEQRMIPTISILPQAQLVKHEAACRRPVRESVISVLKSTRPITSSGLVPPTSSPAGRRDERHHLSVFLVKRLRALGKRPGPHPSFSHSCTGAPHRRVGCCILVSASRRASASPASMLSRPALGRGREPTMHRAVLDEWLSSAA